MKTDEGFVSTVADFVLSECKRTFCSSVGAGRNDSYALCYDEIRPEINEKFDWRQPRE